MFRKSFFEREFLEKTFRNICNVFQNKLFEILYKKKCVWEKLSEMIFLFFFHILFFCIIIFLFFFLCSGGNVGNSGSECGAVVEGVLVFSSYWGGAGSNW